jgi:inosine-uridine nucleoside N-ribohydrolase
MGGSFIGGNITPYAEFNVFTDAEALDVVIRYSDEHNLHLSLVPLDATSVFILKFHNNRKLLLRKNSFKKFKIVLHYLDGPKVCFINIDQVSWKWV